MNFSSSRLAQVQVPSEDNRPVQRFAAGNIQIAVWANVAWDGGKVYRATICRRYRARDGSWKSSSSFLKGDLKDLVNLLQQASEEMLD